MIETISMFGIEESKEEANVREAMNITTGQSLFLSDNSGPSAAPMSVDSHITATPISLSSASGYATEELAVGSLQKQAPAFVQTSTVTTAAPRFTLPQATPPTFTPVQAMPSTSSPVQPMPVVHTAKQAGQGESPVSAANAHPEGSALSTAVALNPSVEDDEVADEDMPSINMDSDSDLD